MNQYKNILIGSNAFSPDWNLALNKINKENIVICNFRRIDVLKGILTNNNINYILPLSNIDYDLIIKHNSLIETKGIKILYPKREIENLLNNKNLFTEFMLEKYSNYIPDIYYLNNINLKSITYPAIYKPIYSTNGINMRIIFNENDLFKLKNKNNIQKFIDYEYEYGAYLLCIDGIAVNWKIIRSKFNKYTIKKRNFPNNYETITNFDTSIFENIIKELNYSGGMCINFKFDEDNRKIYIFEINPRFGGSAFTCNFIYELLCIK